jgi:hypothetical protein
MRKRAGIEFCECGCGERTNLDRQGMPYRYIRNHHRRGKFKPSRPDLQPTRVPTMMDIAWAAGFWEGEGCVQRHRGTPQITAVQKERWCLDRMRQFFGGVVDEPNVAVCHTWRIHGALARSFLRAIWLYLSPRRRRQAEKAGFDSEGGAK